MTEVGFGVIGAGTWGGLHGRVYASTQGARLAAVADTDRARAEALARECGGARAYADYHDLLADPGVAAVSVALPDFLHRDACVAAAEAGKHVLVEKPLATTEKDALDAIRAAQSAGVHLCVDFHNRFSPIFQSLKNSLDAGELGAPQLAHYRLSDTLYVPTRMLRWAGKSSVAWFLASHCLDTLLWLMDARQGGDVPVRLTCVARSRVLSALGIDTPDFYLTTLEWRSGLVTQVENCWVLPECGPSVFDLKCEFIGSRGKVSIDASHHRAVEKQTTSVVYPDLFAAPTVDGRPAGFGAESIRHFVRCVAAGARPDIDGLDGLAVTRLVLKMEDAVQNRGPVDIGDLYAL